MSEHDETNFDPRTALSELMLALDDNDPMHLSAARRSAHRLGESTAAADLTIEQTFELLEREAGEALAGLQPDVLGSIVRGYVDQIVRVRGTVKRPATGPLSSHVARLSALHRINRAATASLRLDEMLSTVVGVINETIDGDACSVFLADPETQTLRLRATIGLNTEAIGRLVIRDDAGITGLAATSKQTQVAAQAQKHPAFFTYPIVGEEDFTSQVSLPLLLREPDRLVGVMNIQSRVPREFDSDEITFLETAAGELSIAIENARLYSQTDAALHRRIADLHMLRTVARTLSSKLRSDELMPLIAEQAATLTSGKQAVVASIYSDGEAVRILRRAAYPEEIDTVAMFSDDMISQVGQAGTAIALHHPDEEVEQLVLGSTLTTGHTTHGVILVSIEPSRNHVEDQLALFQAFSDSAALSVENAELYDEARRGHQTASVLLQEMHHRVRNNLQTVAALLSMQVRHAAYAEWTAPLQEAVARVRSIAAVHSLLSSDNLTSATITSIIKHVMHEASINVVPPGQQINFEVLPSEVEVSSRQATILALLVNECITNAIEHGMAGRESGTVTAGVSEVDGTITVTIDDDGHGIKEDFDPETNTRLGLRIAHTLSTSDLKGTFTLGPRPEGGARAEIVFPAWQR